MISSKVKSSFFLSLRFFSKLTNKLTRSIDSKFDFSPTSGVEFSITSFFSFGKRSFNSSMEVYLEVFVEDSATGERERCNEAMYTFVAVDQLGAPIGVPELLPETKEERERYDGALRRRQLRLILAGKIDPKDATELKALFE